MGNISERIKRSLPSHARDEALKFVKPGPPSRTIPPLPKIKNKFNNNNNNNIKSTILNPKGPPPPSSFSDGTTAPSMLNINNNNNNNSIINDRYNKGTHYK